MFKTRISASSSQFTEGRGSGTRPTKTRRQTNVGVVERAPHSRSSSTQLASQVHARALSHIFAFFFLASGVDAVGEVVMCVDILPQPNGEHKINVKGEQTHLLLFLFLLVFFGL